MISAATATVTCCVIRSVCGSPAVDGYTHVNASCLAASPTARWHASWQASMARRRRRRGLLRSGDGNRLADDAALGAATAASQLVVHMEPHADYDGVAVRWGAGHKTSSAAACAAACLAHRPGDVPGPFEQLPCNAFTYCAARDVCFEPDAHKHTAGDCWLKFTEAPAAPEVNMRGQRPLSLLERHPNAPLLSQWVSGVLLPPGVRLTNGSWSPRYGW